MCEYRHVEHFLLKEILLHVAVVYRRFRHETCLFQYKTIGSEHLFTSIILLLCGGGSGERELTIARGSQ